MLTFSKMHGIGNDYIYINCFQETVTDPEKLSIFMSNVRFGVGSDGLVLILPSEVADFRMRIFNADGSEAMMCGNATRCVGKYVYEHGMTDKTEVSLETNSGIKYLTLYVNEATNKVDAVKVDMGKAILKPAEIPVADDGDRFIAKPVVVDGVSYDMTCVSMGNPHAVVFLPEIDSLDLEKMQPQYGDENIVPFSFSHTAEDIAKPQVLCWLTYTNEKTHQIIRDNLDRSPMFGGVIEGTGPRYCPSIEDKVVRFAGKDRHPIFVEPCGENTEEMYLQGASSSLPEDVQNAFYRSIQGFEHIEIMRPAYAIEYDCVDPTSLEATLESKVVRGLYGAGQFNGTSGYEEAAAQGLLAGLNAARSAKGESQLILERQTSYLGTLVDDLVTKGVMDPYRMMTSRSEYRLTLRQDNADQRLTPIGREYGLVQDDRWAKYQHTQSILEAERRRLHETHLRTADLRAAMEAAGLTPAAEGGIAEELLRRPEISYPLLAGVIGWGEGITPMLAERLETEIKYAGYIARQDRMIRDVARHEKTLIPADFEYADLTGLTLEAREKLTRIRPKNLGQAGRIPGVSPSDVAQLSIALAAAKR